METPRPIRELAYRVHLRLNGPLDYQDQVKLRLHKYRLPMPSSFGVPSREQKAINDQSEGMNLESRKAPMEGGRIQK